jgi:predicted N-acetyltransferase YhbS
MEVHVRAAEANDGKACGRICYRAFATVAERHGFPPDFASVGDATDVVSALIAHQNFFSAVAEEEGTVIGSNFMDVRSSIFSVGPVTVDPLFHNQGVGTELMRDVLGEYVRRAAPGVRLVQVAYNTASMSLYARLGFDVREQFAAIQGLPLNIAMPGYLIRSAGPADLERCNQLCLGVHGHDRSGELQDAISGVTARVVERNSRITGYCTTIGLFGHAVAETNNDLYALIGAAAKFSGTGFLVPVRNTDLLRWCLDQRLRVVYMANLMTIGTYHEPQGVYLASIGY